MDDKYVKFLDFTFERFKYNYKLETNFGELAYHYKKEQNIEMDENDLAYLEDKFFHDLFIPFGDFGYFKLSPSSKDIIDTFGSYSNYLKSKSEYIENQNEIERLNKQVSELSITNLTLQNRQLKTKMLISIISFILGVIATNWKEILIVLKIISPVETK